MNHLMKSSLLVLLLLMVAGPVLAASDTKTEGEIAVGPRFTDVDGKKDRVAEYDIADDGAHGDAGFLPAGWAHMTVMSKKLFLELSAAHTGNSKQQAYRVYLDAARVFKTEFAYNRFPHRLDHDPLFNLDASQVPVKVIGDDLAPAHDYRIAYTNIVSRSEIRIPEADWLKFQFTYRRDERDGAMQGFHISHCATCHVVSLPHEVEENTNHITGTVAMDNGTFGASYTIYYRDTEQGNPALFRTYDLAIHPGLLTDVFTNRTFYDQRNGELPVHQLGQGSKVSHTGKAHYNFNDRSSVAGAIIYSVADSDYTGLEMTSKYYSGRFTTMFQRNIVFNARIRYTDLENDVTFVDLPQRPGVAGPHAGITYSQAYPDFGDTSFTRFSSLDRNNTDLELDLKIPWQRHRFTFEYAFRNIDREYYGNDATKKHQFTAAFRSDPRRSFAGHIIYKAEFSENPFVNFQAAIAPALQPFPTVPESPFPGVQYYEIYEARQANLSNQPTDIHNIDLAGSWKPRNDVGIHFSYNYRDSKNDDLNYSDWSQSIHHFNANLWYVPEEHVSLTAGFNYSQYKSETLFTQPVWNG